MKNKVLVILLVALLAASAAILAIFLTNTKKDTRLGLREVGQPPEQPGREPHDQTVFPIANMSLEEKIGQMLIVGFEGAQVDDHAQRMITQYHVGGINLLKRNVEGKEQVKQLALNLQSLAKIPLFIATDQEGGSASRFDFLNELTPQLQIKDPLEAERIAHERAAELKELGINMNFSPVLDYASDKQSYIYNRTFGVEPDSSGELGIAMIKGYLNGSVIPVAKHFPGYGNMSSDPHRKQALINVEDDELRLFLLPFQKAIADSAIPAIMTAHALIPAVDDQPATLSSKFLGEILRKQMGFNGVIITDDLEMASVGMPAEEAAVEAIKAGADMVISTYAPEKQIQIFNRLKEAVLNGGIGEERINESVERILKLKTLLE